jgi:MazG family protein
MPRQPPRSSQRSPRLSARTHRAVAAAAAREFARLVEIMATLRSPEGCPWDREQTIDSLKPFVLEETHELLEAIDQHNHTALREELGDFLFEAVFVAQLESEDGHFTVADAVRAVSDKLVRRHPHVFARAHDVAPLETADQVRVRWEEIKTEERGASGAPKTLLGGIPQGLPALLRAYQLGARAASVGFDWDRPAAVMTKIQEEVDELRDVVNRDGSVDESRREEEMGDLLFAIANLSRKLGVDPETALRKASVKFTRRFTAMEGRIVASGRKVRDLSLEELEHEWQLVKLEPALDG